MHRIHTSYPILNLFNCLTYFQTNIKKALSTAHALYWFGNFSPYSLRWLEYCAFTAKNPDRRRVGTPYYF